MSGTKTCKKTPPYLEPATPGMAGRLYSVKTRAIVNGGSLPGQGCCTHHCTSRFASTYLTPVDMAKSMALTSFL